MRTISRLGLCAVVLGGVALVAACGSDSGSEGGLASDGGAGGSSSAGKGGSSAGTGGAAAGTGGAAAGTGGAAAGTGGAAAGTGGAGGSAGQAGSASGGKGGSTGGSGGAAGGSSGAAGAAAGTGGGAGTGTGGTSGKGGAAGAAGKGGSAGASGKGGSAGTGTGGTAGAAGTGTGGAAGTGTGGSAGTGTGGSGGAPSCVGVFQAGVCATCLEGSCCSEVSACDADVDGICLDCVTGASNDPACGTNAPAEALLTCVKASCNTECLPHSTCNPVTNEGCTGAGQACDLDANGVFSCFDPPNDVALCGGCDNTNGPFCAPTTHCVGAQCTRICKGDGDCMGQGVCDTALGVEGFGFCVVTAGAGDQAAAPCGG